MKAAAMCFALTLLLCACHEQHAQIVVPPPPTVAPLPSPTLISPTDKSAFQGYPRRLTMRWSEVPGAVTYRVEVDCYGCCVAHEFCSDVGKPTYIGQADSPSYSHEFVGDQPGRWRIWAVDKNGIAGAKSEWRAFTFGRVYEGNVIPPNPPPLEAKDVAPCHSSSYPPVPRGATSPAAIYNPDPEYSEAARKDKIMGTVLLGVQVGEDGLVKDVCVVRSLRADLDANAVAAVRTWRFEPAVKDGARIPASVNVMVDFRLR